MSNSLSAQSSYFRPEFMQRSQSITDDSAKQALLADTFQNQKRLGSKGSSMESSAPLSMLPGVSLFHGRKPSSLQDSHKKEAEDGDSLDADGSLHTHKRSRRSDRLFDKDSNYQARQARNKHFRKYERYDHFKDGEKITRESVRKRLPETEALAKLRERAKKKEGANKEERLARREAKVELEMYYETNYRRVKYHGDKGIIAYSDKQANKARDNSERQDAKNQCGHFKHINKQIAGYDFNNGYSVVMGWMTSPGHRAELLKLNNKTMGASQINVASTINFGTVTA